MTLFRPIFFAAALLCGTAAAVADAQTSSARRMTIIREQRVIRIPLQPMTAIPLPRPTPEWKERRGPKCIARADIVGASLSGTSSIDFMLRDRTRLRAKLERSCPGIDYYAGFYVNPTSDGKVCEDRDAVHARSGGECQIDGFRKLTPRAAAKRTRSAR